jgi:LCP family protein required for cell wall assembly
MRGVGLIALLVGLASGCLVVLLGVVLTVRVLYPDWYAVPGAVLQMTGQDVPAPAASAAEPEPEPIPDLSTPTLSDAPPPTDSDAAPPTDPTPPARTGVAEPPPDRAVKPEPMSVPLLPGHRFNVLLLGSDNDLKFAPDAVLTQAMILVSIDPNTHDVAMVSIPRDFWVPIRGYGYQKIDVAYEVGGVALARSTVESLFGVKIDYYAWVGLNGLVQVIDTLGGIDITVQHPILDEAYPDDLNTDDPYAFIRLYLPAGPQHLDGTTALQYVRSRHGDFLSDFGRSQRQQQVLLAIKNRVQSTSAISRIPQLVAALEGSVKTDFSVPAILQLAALARNIPASNIHRQVLSAPDFASTGYSPDGTQQVVYPNWDTIRPTVARLIRSNAPTAGAAVAAGR